MIFQNLWGFLLLLSIPVLIIIYIIKQDHKERAVSSTYLWHLSERFLKKRLPIKRITSLLAFLLQLAILAFLAFSATQPAMAVGQVSGHIIVLDASASMQTEQDGVTRFEAAVSEVKALAESGLCSAMTVIIASDTPAAPVVGGNSTEALVALDNAVCGYGGCNVYETMKLVREAYTRMGSAKVTFYTDTTYEDVENVTVVDMRRNEKNVAITSLTHTGGKFEGTLVSYGEDKEVTVGLYIDGLIVNTASVMCTDGQPAEVSFDVDVAAFKEATLRFELEDALEIDNSFSVMGRQSEMASVLVVGDETLFFETGFEALGNCEVTVKKTYNKRDDGQYDLYVFSGCVPKEESGLPTQGTVVGFMQKAGKYFLDESKFFGMTFSGYPATVHLALELYRDTDPLFIGAEQAIREVYCGQYNKCYSLASGGREGWKSICSETNYLDATCIHRKTNAGYHQYMFTFPIFSSNMALTPAFIIILENARNIASPPTIPRTQYIVGEEVSFAIKDGAEKPRVAAADDTVTDLSLKTPVFIPAVPGVHTLTYELNDRAREASFFVCIAPEEYESYSTESLFLSEEFERQVAGELLTTSAVPAIAIALLVLLILEWGYHYRGKY